MTELRIFMRCFLAILLLVLVAPGQRLFAAEAPAEAPTATGWIRSEEVPARAEALRRKLEVSLGSPTATADLERIELDLNELSPDLDILLETAAATLARSASFLLLDDLLRQLDDTSAPLTQWATALDADVKRAVQTLDAIANEQRIWFETRAHAEAAGAVSPSIQRSIELLETSAVKLRGWRERALALSERLTDRRAIVDEMSERLRASFVAQQENLLVPGHAAVFQHGFGAELVAELPHVPSQIFLFAGRTAEYARRTPRPIVLQVLLAALLMVGSQRISARARKRLTGRDDMARTVRRLERPYAVGLLLALLATPALHPLAPLQFNRLLAFVTLFPVARIVIHSSQRRSMAAFAGLFLLLLLDRFTLALAPLPAVAGVTFLLFLAVAIAFALWLRRRIALDDGAPWLHRATTVALLAFALATAADLGGWFNLATLVGRSLTTSGLLGLYVYTAVVTLTPLAAYGLTSPALRHSHLLSRNTQALQVQVERVLRWLGTLFWIYLTLRATGLLSLVREALSAVLHVGIAVGTLSLSLGGLLAFVLTLLTAMLVARLINRVLEEDVFPRARLARGVPDAISTLVRYAVYSLGFLMALAGAGVELSQLSILLGGFGVGIGLGLQDLVKNFAAGLTILGERRLQVGDAIQIKSQEIFGRVRSVGTRATVVRNWNGSEVIVPNADLVSNAVTNWTLSDRLCRVEVPVGVAYGTDPDRVVALLLEVAKSNEHMLPTPAPQVLFKGFGESSLDFVLRAWTDEEYDRVAALTSELALAVHRTLVAAAVPIPFPQRDLHLASVSAEAQAALAGAKPVT